MAGFRTPVAALAVMAAAAFYIAPATAEPPDMTPVPPHGVRIVLPSGAVIINRERNYTWLMRHWTSKSRPSTTAKACIGL